MNRRKFLGCFAFLPFVGAKPMPAPDERYRVNAQLIEAKMKLAERKRYAACRKFYRDAWEKYE